MQTLIYLIKTFLTLCLCTKLVYSLNEFGWCTVAIQGKQNSQITKMNFSWKFVGNDLEIDKQTYVVESAAMIELSANNRIIRDFPLLLVQDISSQYSDPFETAKVRYLKVRKAAIKEKNGNIKNVMEFDIVTLKKTDLGKRKPKRSTRYKVLTDQSQCRIRYGRTAMPSSGLPQGEEQTLYIEKLSGFDMANNLATRWWYSVESYVVPKHVAEKDQIIPMQLVDLIPQKPKGVCFFDIDGTLTQNIDKDKNQQIMMACLDHGFLVGIVTASDRTITDVCNGDKVASSSEVRREYISKDFCDLIKRNNGYMYNNRVIRSGITAADDLQKAPYDTILGARKAYQVHYWRNKYYPSMPDECVVLFDNNLLVLKEYRNYGKFKPDGQLVYERLNDGIVDMKPHTFNTYWARDTSKEMEEYKKSGITYSEINLFSAQNVADFILRRMATDCTKEIEPTGLLTEPTDQKID